METAQRAEDNFTPNDKGHLGKLRTILSDASNWDIDVNLRLQVFLWAKERKAILTPLAWQEVLSLLSERSGLSKEHIKEILSLRDKAKIARALTPPPPRPPLDTSVYPAFGWLADYLAYSSGNECPTAFHFWTGLSVLAAAAKRNFFLDMGAFFIYPNIYVLLIAPSGGKKSFSLGLGTDILEELNSLLKELPVPEHELIYIAPKKIGPERLLSLISSQEIPLPLQGTTTHTESTAFLASSELAVLLGKTVFHSEQFVHLLTDLWDWKGEYPLSTFGRGNEVLRDPTITLVGCSTQDWLLESVTDELFTGGFMARCHIIPRGYTDKSFPVPHALDPLLASSLARRLTNIAVSPKTQVELYAWKAYEDWYTENRKLIKGTHDNRLSGYYQRKDTHLLKLSMLLALSRDRVHILEEDLSLADQILSHEESYLPPLLVQVGQHPQAKVTSKVLARLERIAASDPNGVVSRSELSRATFAITGGARILNYAIDTLVSNREITTTPAPPGRNGTFYRRIK